MRTLYLCYFGLREPLVQTQVLPYLREIAQSGIEVELLTFDPGWPSSWTRDDTVLWRDRLLSTGIVWHAMTYHKRPSLPATLFDIFAGAFKTVELTRRSGMNVYHARGYVPAMMGALAKSITGAKLIFDIRGFMPEEYVDAGVWTENGLIFRLAKAAERWLLRKADGFVVLTEKAKQILFPGSLDRDSEGRPIEVIPCCVDSERFRPAKTFSRQKRKQDLGLEGRFVIAYVGALGGWYLTREMADFFRAARIQDSSVFPVIFTQSNSELIAGYLRTVGFTESDYLIRRIDPDELPDYLMACDAAISFIKPCYSKLSSSPTKIAEYLAAGLPIISNSGIGDLDDLLTDDRVGVILEKLDQEEYKKGLAEIKQMINETDLVERCQRAANKRFDLITVGGPAYIRLYRRLKTGE